MSNINDMYNYHYVNGEILHMFRELKTQGEKIMSAISDFAAKMKVHEDHIGVAISGLKDDVQHLNDQIKALQASQGVLTVEDQKLLDDIESKAAGLHEQLDALDALTPPVVPVPVVPAP